MKAQKTELTLDEKFYEYKNSIFQTLQTEMERVDNLFLDDFIKDESFKSEEDRANLDDEKELKKALQEFFSGNLWILESPIWDFADESF